MPVTEKENEAYRLFVVEKAQEIKCFDYQPKDVIWHYTNGDGLLGILQSASIHATQVASLNDKNETKYATDLFKISVRKILEENKDHSTATAFLEKVLEYIKEDPLAPSHGTSKFFVTCFSAEEDDVNQWDRYGKPNGYAIGFYAGGLFRDATSTVYKVNYDKALHEKISDDTARATLRFFLDGLSGERLNNPGQWAEEFFAAWDEWVYRLSPTVKDAKWKAENEFRLVHELKVSELPDIRFKQRASVLARYLPLTTASWSKQRRPLLPIAKIIIGPGPNSSFTKVSVSLLLEQMGYMNVPVELSQCSLQHL